jgi:hypothetical protein
LIVPGEAEVPVRGSKPKVTAAEFGDFVDAATRKWSEVIREANLKGE